MTKILNILKTLAIVTGAIGMAFGVFEMYDSIRDSQKEQSQKLISLDKKIDNVNVAIDSIFTLTELNRDAIKDQNNNFISLEKSFKFYRDNVDRIDKLQMEQIIIDAYGLGLAEGKKKDLTLSEMIDGIQ